MNTSTKAITVQSQIWLFEIPVYLKGVFTESGTDRLVRFTVRVGDKTLGEVLRYMLDAVGGPRLALDPPWNAIEQIRLDSFEFIIELKNGETSYGMAYNQLDVDLGFASFDKLEVMYAASGAKKRSLDVKIFGSFLGVDFSDNPISWDALKEQPPQSPAKSDKVFKLEYLGLGQRVTLNNVTQYETIGAVMGALEDSYFKPGEDKLNPLLTEGQDKLVYDESAAWLVGAKFSVLETFDFQGLWNLPTLAGARIALRGERAKSLAGFEFEILYRKIAEDLGQYHIELVLPDVLRRFQAGAASVTLPIIAIEIYTDGGFKIDLGFPENLNFERSFAIELMIGPIPVTGALGIYFGRLSPKAVPGVPAITGGDFGPVIIAGAGFRIGIGKSIKAGILEAGFFLGIEGLVEGVVGFFEPWEKSEPKATYYRVTGTLQLTGHIYGKVDFAIISAAVDIYAYISVSGTFEAYRATVLVFEAGVRVKLTVKINLGLFKIPIELSFSATIREQTVIGADEQTPWQIESEVGTTLRELLGPVGYRRLPTGEIVADPVFARIHDPDFDWAAAAAARADECEPDALAIPEKPEPLELYFRPITSLGLKGDTPGSKPDANIGEANLVVALMLRTSRETGETLSPAEKFAELVLRFGLTTWRKTAWIAGADFEDDTVTLSELSSLRDRLEGDKNPIVITPKNVEDFFKDWAAPIIKLAPWDNTSDGPQLTPFPMIPLLTLTASDNGTEAHCQNFESGPLCSAEYQHDIREYFKNLDPMRDSQETPTEAVLGKDGKELSMAQLIFIDCFKLTLRKVVSEAIEELTLVTLAANGRSVSQVATDCGIDHAAGVQRIIGANLDNEELFAAKLPIVIAKDGALLDTTPNLVRLGKKVGMTPLATARSIFQQKVISEDADITLRGVRHMLKVSDTRQSLLDYYGLKKWSEIEKANPVMDWDVPKPVPDSPYPTLELPAGSWIKIPHFAVPSGPDRTISAISNTYGLSPADVIWKPNSIAFAPERLAQIALSTQVEEGDTIADLADRFGLTRDQIIDASLLFDPAIISPEQTLAVRHGSHLIARDDTLESIAAAHQTTVEEIKEFNKDDPWKFNPRPETTETLPMGVSILLPPVEKFVPRLGDTFLSIAQLFELEPKALALLNADTLELPKGAQVFLPPFAVAPETASSPIAAAAPFAITPDGLLRANQGTASGWGAPAPLGTVVVPYCEEMAESELINRLADAEGGSKLTASAQAQSRFLLAGLRLPDPSDPAMASDPETDKQLWPLYTLTGQQWAAPDAPSGTYEVKLAWNSSDKAQAMATALLDEVVDPEPAKLTADDIELIKHFRSLGATPADINILASQLAEHPYPAYQQIKIEKTLGAATEWDVPEAISFDGAPVDETVIKPLLLEVPVNIRSMLPSDNADRAALLLSEVSPDPISGKPMKRTIGNAGWATAIEMQIRQSFGSEDEGAPLKATYEAISIAAQGQADLEGLRSYIHDFHDGNPIDIYLLYSTDPLSPVSDGLSSDAMSATARSKIALLKSNLSTFSNPAASFSRVPMFDDGEMVASATLTEGERFLDLLWQISVTNGGGFFLNCPDGPDGPGLPNNLFEDGDTARVTLLVALRVGDPEVDPYLPTIRPAKFHNTVVTAENLTSARADVQIEASTRTVGHVPDSDPAITQSLSDIAGTLVTVEELALLNESNHTLLHAGAEIPQATGAPYKVKPGDDLLGIANMMGIGVDALATQIAPLTGLLEYGAIVAMRPGWVTGKSRVEPEQGGFEIIRSQPVEPPQVEAITREESIYRIQTMFQMMGYALDAQGVFSASNHGLAIMPDEPDKDNPLARYGMDGDAPQPWVYRRLLPIAPFAEPGKFEQIDSVDPYGGLGTSAKVTYGYQDIFGNRLPVPSDDPAISWPQLYRDPLIPLHAWPSVTLAYDVGNSPTQNSPQIRIKVKFAPAGYAASIGVSADRLCNKAMADQKRFALAYYQVAGQRVDAEVNTTLTKDQHPEIDSKRLADFARDAFEYLGAIQQLQPLNEPITDRTTLRKLAAKAAVTPEQVALHLASQEGLLQRNAPLMLPERMTVLPNVSLEEIAEQMNGEPNAGKIGSLNEEVELTAGLELRLGTKDYKTKPGDRLKDLKDIAPGDRTVYQIANQNREVKGLFSEGADLFLGLREIKIGKDETLAGISAREAVPIEMIAQVNADQKFFAASGEAELPLHMVIPAGTPKTASIDPGESFKRFVVKHTGSDKGLRDVLTANAATTGLLKKGAKVKYSAGGQIESETVGIADTWATICLRLSAKPKIDDASLKPADVGALPDNADNPDLYNADALMLLPPIRFGKDIDVPHSASREVVTDRLGVEIRMYRNEPSLIDPAFRNLPEVESVVSTVPARLSSGFSREKRGTLLAFAEEFQKTFDNLKLCVGPDTFTSVSPRALLERDTETESKLVAVNWSPKGFSAKLSGPPLFFAPRPLRKEPWSQDNVPILPYVSGQPLADGTPVSTNFNNADLERWATTLLAKIDRILLPDLAAPLRALAPEQFAKITEAKANIAKAVSARIDQVLDRDLRNNPPDPASAAEQLEQQLLVELAKTYRGGVVAQFDVSATMPNGQSWTSDTAPRLLCAARPVLYKVPEERDHDIEPTLDGIGKHFHVSGTLMGTLLEKVENLLKPGYVVPVGSKPTVKPTQTIAQVAEAAKVQLETLVDAVKGDLGFLRPGAEIPIAKNAIKTELDETLGSALERLAPNLTSVNLLDYSINIFVEINGDQKEIFEPKITLEWPGSKAYRTTGKESFNDVIRALNAPPIEFFTKYLVEAPLLKPDVEFTFLTRLPPITASASKITLFSDTGFVNKLNTVVVNTMPDQATSLPLELHFEVQAMEYNIHNVADGGDYQASEWLTFIFNDLDQHFEQSLGAFDLPVPNRQFPIPPQILTHDVFPEIKDGDVVPADIGKIMFYDYRLRFAFDAAAQDEISYTRYEPDADDLSEKDPLDPPPPGVALAYTLAQFQAIEEAMFDDILIMRKWDDQPMGDTDEKVVRNAINIFATLGKQASEEWSQWTDEGAGRAAGEKFRIKHHKHPAGHSLITVIPESATERSCNAPGGLPRVSLVGRENATVSTPNLTATSIAKASSEDGEQVVTEDGSMPVPRTRLGEFYQVDDQHLNLLRYQRCWGGISIMRNRRLVENVETADPFVLHVPDIRAITYLTPSFTYAQRIDLGTEIAPLADRLKTILENIYFPDGEVPVPTRQRVSASMAFTRPAATASSGEQADPADWKSIYVPVSTTPLIELDKDGADNLPTPKAVGDTIAQHLNEFLSGYDLAPTEKWSITLKLFSHLAEKDTPPQLLEVIDVRVRMSDQ
ncbi:MAG: LysM domain-containing protein [Pseudomonadota bacterium]